MCIRHVTTHQEGALLGRRDQVSIRQAGDSIQSFLDPKVARNGHSLLLPPSTTKGLVATKASRIAHLSKVPLLIPVVIARCFVRNIFLTEKRHPSPLGLWNTSNATQYFQEPKHAGVRRFTLSSRRCYCSGADNRLGCAVQGDRSQPGHAF